MKTKYYIAITFIFILLTAIVVSCSKEGDASIDGKNAPDGKSGSTARITIKGNYIYAVDNSSLNVIDISTPGDPQYIRRIEIGFGIETIYPFKEYLFIGSNMGMFIYSLAQPDNPVQLSAFEHITACDPVIANDTLAFVTLRNNEVCRMWQDTRQLDIIDITNITQPFLIKSYNTTDYPYGLDLLDNYLFVCYAEGGVVVYDIKKLLDNNPAEISQITGINAYDVILYQNILFIIGESGFYQYDYTNINNITQISSILKGQ